MKLKEMLELLEKSEVHGDMDVEITGIEYDSRRVTSGSLFVAIEGENQDGHSFIPDALKRGASALVLQKDFKSPSTPMIRVSDSREVLARISAHFFGEPSQGMKMVGITGTNGKTTTSYILKSILDASGIKTGLIGTIDYRIGDVTRRADKTTPESLDLQRILGEMKSSGMEVVVMEVSSHGLAQKRTYGIDFDITLFTNLSRDHLDFHKTMDSYGEAKMKLFEGLSQEKKAILNFDDPFSEKIRDRTNAEIITYGLKEGADFRGVIQSFTLQGSEMKVFFNDEEAVIQSRLPGRTNLSNLLGAFALGISMGYSLEEVLMGIREVHDISGRLEPVEAGQPFKVFVDYAHTPDALKKVLLALKELTPNKVIVIFGCGGNRDRGKRPIMAKVATENAHFVILTSDNPRNEDPITILNAMKKGIAGGNYEIIPDRREAIQRGIELAKEGDTILIAGKGHEDYQVIGDEKFPFDDQEVARGILEKISSSGSWQ
jgi:UDP-N-acetylmuramoyl-L-alanyl-D-glutamate--2,6-diaminopimelate ligase